MGKIYVSHEVEEILKQTQKKIKELTGRDISLGKIIGNMTINTKPTIIIYSRPGTKNKIIDYLKI